MVKKSTIIFWSVLFSVDIGLILYSLLAHQGMYLYMKIDSLAWFHIALLVALNGLAILLFCLVQKCHWIISGVLTPVCLLFTVITVLLSVIAGPIGCRMSETENYEEYIGADARVCENFEFAGLTLDDITNMEIEKVENFRYHYRNNLFDDNVKFIGKFYFSKNDYESLRARYSSTEGIEEITYSAEEQELYGFTGCYDIDESERVYGLTTVLDWDEFEIKFNDEENAIYFVFDGWIG